jgi:hypothetical protein
MDQQAVAGDWDLKLWEIHRRECNSTTILERKNQTRKSYRLFNSCCGKEIYKRSIFHVQVIPIRVSLDAYMSLIILFLNRNWFFYQDPVKKVLPAYVLQKKSPPVTSGGDCKNGIIFIRTLFSFPALFA